MGNSGLRVITNKGDDTMEGFIYSTNIELADVQQTVSLLIEKLNYYKANYSYATYEINRMEVALDVLNDLENDVASESI